MVSLDFAESIEKAVKDFAKEDKRTSFLRLCPMSEETQEEKGSRAHPGQGTHKRAFELLTEKIEAVLEGKT